MLYAIVPFGLGQHEKALVHCTSCEITPFSPYIRGPSAIYYSVTVMASKIIDHTGGCFSEDLVKACMRDATGDEIKFAWIEPDYSAIANLCFEANSDDEAQLVFELEGT